MQILPVSKQGSDALSFRVTTQSEMECMSVFTQRFWLADKQTQRIRELEGSGQDAATQARALQLEIDRLKAAVDAAQAGAGTLRVRHHLIIIITVHSNLKGCQCPCM